VSKTIQDVTTFWRFLATSLGKVCFLAIVLLSGEWLGGLQILEASPENDVHIRILSGLETLYQGEFEQALESFRALARDEPADPRGYFFLALTYRWLTRIEPGSETYQDQFEKNIEESLAVAKSLLAKEENHPDALLYLAAAYGYRAEYYNFLKQKWNKAYDDGVQMREYLEKAEEFADTMIDVQLGYGLYNYYAYYYRKKIGWWRFLLLLPKGDKEKGLQLLETVRQNGVYAKVEAWYFLIDIYKNDAEYSDRAIGLCEELHRTFPSQPFFYTLLAGLYHKNHQWDNSIRVAREILAQAPTNPYYSNYLVYQAKYLIAESSFFQGKYQEALPFFDEIIASQLQRPGYLLPWSHLRRGTIYDLQGEKQKATAEYKRVLEMENVHDVHKMAQGLLKNQQKKN
jgi:hypothetical protein